MEENGSPDEFAGNAAAVGFGGSGDGDWPGKFRAKCLAAGFAAGC